MNNYCIRDGYTPRLQPDYFADVRADGKLWQPHIIPIAAHLARTKRAKRLVDIGCGRGIGLTPYAREFDLVGIDFGGNLQWARDNHDFGTWIDCDLENNMPDMDWQTFKNSVVICSDVIEHLVQPDYLLATLMSALCCCDYVVLSTPDRLRTYGYDQSGMPGNVHHVREWTLDELTELLESCGMGIAWRGWTVSNNVDLQKNTILMILMRRDLCYNIQEMLAPFDVEVAP